MGLKDASVQLGLLFLAILIFTYIMVWLDKKYGYSKPNSYLNKKFR